MNSMETKKQIIDRFDARTVINVHREDEKGGESV